MILQSELLILMKSVTFDCVWLLLCFGSCGSPFGNPLDLLERVEVAGVEFFMKVPGGVLHFVEAIEV